MKHYYCVMHSKFFILYLFPSSFDIFFDILSLSKLEWNMKYNMKQNKKKRAPIIDYTLSYLQPSKSDGSDQIFLLNKLKWYLYVVINHIYRVLSSAGKTLTDNFLIELAKREEPNRSGKMTVSIRFDDIFRNEFEKLI